MKDQSNVLRNLEELQLTRTDLINTGLNEILTRLLDSAPMDCLLEKQPDLVDMATSLINEYTNILKRGQVNLSLTPQPRED